MLLLLATWNASPSLPVNCTTLSAGWLGAVQIRLLLVYLSWLLFSKLNASIHCVCSVDPGLGQVVGYLWHCHQLRVNWCPTVMQERYANLVMTTNDNKLHGKILHLNGMYYCVHAYTHGVRSARSCKLVTGCMGLV